MSTAEIPVDNGVNVGALLGVREALADTPHNAPFQWRATPSRVPGTHNQTSNVLSLETNLFNLVGAALKAKGHEVRAVDGGAVGGYQGILFTRDPRLPEPTFDRRWADEDRPVNGVYRAGSDHRKDGQAAGW